MKTNLQEYTLYPQKKIFARHVALPASITFFVTAGYLLNARNFRVNQQNALLSVDKAL